MSRSDGNWADDPALAQMRLRSGRDGKAAVSQDTPKRGDPLGASISAFMEERRRLGGIDKKRVMDFEAALRLFEGWCGTSTLLPAIDKRKVGEFRSLLAKLPPNHTKRFRGQTLVEIVAVADAEGLPPLNPLTANSKYLALLEAFFEWCQSGGRIDENPAKGVRIKPPKSHVAGTKRGTFTPDHYPRTSAGFLSQFLVAGQRSSILVPDDHRRETARLPHVCAGPGDDEMDDEFAR
jgi:hypothetical protein